VSDTTQLAPRVNSRLEKSKYLRNPTDELRFLLPTDYDSAAVLPERLKKHKDDANWLIATVARKAAYDDVDEFGYARLHSAILRRVMAKRSQPAIVSAHVDEKVLDPLAPYCPGVKSKGFRLHEKFLNGRLKVVVARDANLIKRVCSEFDRAKADERRQWLPIHFELESMQRLLSIEKDSETILEKLPPESRLCQDILVHNIRHRSLSFRVSTTGRVFNAITGLKRELRKTVRLEGCPIAGVDLKCAQPTLLAMLIGMKGGENVPTYIQEMLELFPSSVARHGSGGSSGIRFALSDFAPLPAKDFFLFRDSVLSGSLYEELIGRCFMAGVRMPEQPRDWIKKSFLRDVLAKKGNYPSDVERVFRRTFPSVYRMVRWINLLDHAELIRTLQRLESWFVIEQISPRLVKKGVPFITLHDAIYGRASDVQIIASTFQETSDALGLRMSFKAEE
jgi:hypothetical protein